jgi:hypothetical protein
MKGLGFPFQSLETTKKGNMCRSQNSLAQERETVSKDHQQMAREKRGLGK